MFRAKSIEPRAKSQDIRHKTHGICILQFVMSGCFVRCFKDTKIGKNCWLKKKLSWVSRNIKRWQNRNSVPSDMSSRHFSDKKQCTCWEIQLRMIFGADSSIKQRKVLKKLFWRIVKCLFSQKNNRIKEILKINNLSLNLNKRSSLFTFLKHTLWKQKKKIYWSMMKTKP